MTNVNLAGQLWSAMRRHARVLLAVVPGVFASALHSTMLVVPRTDFIDALDSDRYRIQWITGAYLLGTAAGMALTQFAGSRLGLRYAYLLGVACFTLAGTACALVNEVIWMTPLRLGQGLGNGLIISVGMVLIWRAFPVHQGLAVMAGGTAAFTTVDLYTAKGLQAAYMALWGAGRRFGDRSRPVDRLRGAEHRGNAACGRHL